MQELPFCMVSMPVSVLATNINTIDISHYFPFDSVLLLSFCFVLLFSFLLCCSSSFSVCDTPRCSVFYVFVIWEMLFHLCAVLSFLLNISLKRTIIFLNQHSNTSATVVSSREGVGVEGFVYLLMFRVFLVAWMFLCFLEVTD